MKVLVLASTFPASDSDPVPAFVKDQIIAMYEQYPHLHFTILAPHDYRSGTKNYKKHKAYDEYRFHYAWPRRLEKLAGRGIMPQLSKNPLYYLLIPNLFIAEYWSLRKLSKKINPDVIYSHWFTPQGIIAGHFATKHDIPAVLTTHASDVAVWKKLPIIGKYIVKKYIKKTDKITAVSQRTLEKLKYFYAKVEWSAIEHKIKIIPMGVSLEQESLDKSVGEPGNILFIGRLAEKKGLQYLLPAYADVVKNHSNAKLTVAGDGPMLDDLLAKSKRLGISTIFPGYISGKSKQKLLDQATIYVVPSIITSSGDAEGLPVSLMEGLAAGKICIATNESGADNIITDGNDGFLVPQKDKKALANAIEKSLQLSSSQQAKMQKAAKNTAKQFDWKTIAKEHYDFLFKDK